ncbi:MAG TPA: hypothetical protein PKH77_12460 [Anaerolineae bacterium]|nr:hypothetical protein [Anaerolineae bacterium]
MNDRYTPKSLAAQLAATPAEQQAQVLRTALAARWQPQLAAHLDYWARLGLARLRAARQARQRQPLAVSAPLRAATVWITPVWPGDSAPEEPPLPRSDIALPPQEAVFRLDLAIGWESQLAVCFCQVKRETVDE